MAVNSKPQIQLSTALARVGWISSIATALILTSVIAGNLLVLVAGVQPTLWLLALVDIGPVVAVFLGNIATFINYYGAYRVVRRLDEYDVKGDAKNQLLQVPGLAQNVPEALRRRMGCAPAVAVSTLVASLAVTTLTLAPPPVRMLGAGLPPNGTPSPASTASTVATATATPTETPATLTVTPTAFTETCGANGQLDPLTLTLDYPSGTTTTTWTVSKIDPIPAFSTAVVPWATAKPTSGELHPGARADLVLTPSGRICATLKQPQTFTAVITASGAVTASYTISDTISPFPPIG